MWRLRTPSVARSSVKETSSLRPPSGAQPGVAVAEAPASKLPFVSRLVFSGAGSAAIAGRPPAAVISAPASNTARARVARVGEGVTVFSLLGTDVDVYPVDRAHARASRHGCWPARARRQTSSEL